MSDFADAIDDVRAELAAVAGDILPDTCSFSGPGSESRDAFGEVSTTDTTTIESCPCKVLELSAFERLSGGEVTARANSKLQVPFNSDTAGIGGGHRGTIAARGVMGARDFEVAGPPLGSSTDIWMYFAIILK